MVWGMEFFLAMTEEDSNIRERVTTIKNNSSQRGLKRQALFCRYTKEKIVDYNGAILGWLAMKMLFSGWLNEASL